MTEQTLTGYGVCCVLSSANWKEFLFIAKPNFLWLGLPLKLLLCLQHMLLLLLQGLSVACCCCYSWSCTRCDAAAQGGGHPDMLLLLWTLNPWLLAGRSIGSRSIRIGQRCVHGIGEDNYLVDVLLQLQRLILGILAVQVTLHHQLLHMLLLLAQQILQYRSIDQKINRAQRAQSKLWWNAWTHIYNTRYKRYRRI